ncbi:flocculation protein FLO11-like [Huso huso]|uniref:Flocculation protein FLO11-like n=1 Tax=Huso huso TaxID=61971 RepID=A0ABR0ZM22_HUSHU
MRMGSAFFVNMRCPVTETTTGKSTKPAVVCRNTSMMVELPEGSLKPVQVIDEDNRPVAISDALLKCGYLVVERGGKIIFTAVYAACDVKIVDGNYILTLFYTTTAGKRGYVHMRCPTKAPTTTNTKPTKTTRTSAGEMTKAPTSVVCRASSMVLELPKEPLKRVLFLDKSNQWVAVIDAHKYCNYTLSQGIGRNFFITPYTACDVRILDGNYILTLLYTTTAGKRGYVHMRCPTMAPNTN